VVNDPAFPHQRIRVWDIPTRFAHWAVVALFALCWWTAKSDRMKWHVIAGYCLFAVILFRLGWGVVGSDTARFTHFVRSPAVIVKYARTLTRPSKTPAVGHNPMGGWSVLLMLGLLLAQTVVGLFSVDVDALSSGPLARWVSFEVGRTAAHWHANIFYASLAFIGLHLAAISFYGLALRQNLLSPMLHGYTVGKPPQKGLYFAPLWHAMAFAVLAAFLVMMLANA
jgi:cytochrome b